MALAYLLYRRSLLERALRKVDYVDKATGLYKRKGFVEELDSWLAGEGCPVMLFFFSIEGYTQAVRLIGPEEEEAFLRSIPVRLNEYIHLSLIHI